MFDPGAAGHTRFFGGTFVAIVTAMGRVLHDFPDELFAVSIAVGEGCVDEVQPEFECAAKRPQRLIVCAAFPLFAADAPGAVADLADLETSPAEFPVSHESMVLPGWGTSRRQPAPRVEESN